MGRGNRGVFGVRGGPVEPVRPASRGGSVRPPAASRPTPQGVARAGRAAVEPLESRLLLAAAPLAPRGAVVAPAKAVVVTTAKPAPKPAAKPSQTKLASASAAAASPAPGVPALAAASDTGVSATDRNTSANNASPEKALTFAVPSTVAGATVTVYANGVAVGSAVATGTTTTVTTSGQAKLADGGYTVTVRQAAPDQAESPNSPSVFLTIDSTAPTAPGMPDLDSPYDSGASNTDNVTNADTLRVGVLTSREPFFRLYRDGVQVNAAYHSSGSYVFLTRHAAGVFGFTGTWVDLAGNESPASAPLQVTVDRTPPVAAAALGNVTASGGPAHTFTVTYTDRTAASVVQVGIGDVWVDGPPPYAYSTVPALASTAATADGTGLTATYRVDAPYGSWHSYDNGTYTVTLRPHQVFDLAGNAAPPSQLGTFVVAVAEVPATPVLAAGSDTGASSTDGVTRLNNATPAAALSFEVAGTVPGAAVTLLADGVPVGQAVAAGPTTVVTTDGATPLADGYHRITARQRLSPGADTPKSDVLDVYVDTAAPVAPHVRGLHPDSDSGVSDADGITNAAALKFGGWPTELAGRVGLTYDGGGGSGPSMTLGNGGGAVELTYADPLADGAYTFRFWAEDAAGNRSAGGVPMAVTVDRTAPATPAAPVLTAAGDSGVSQSDGVTNVPTLVFDVSAAAAPFVTVYQTWPNGAPQPVTGPYTTGPSFAMPYALPDGEYTFSLQSTDAAGNTSAPGPQRAFRVDTAPPPVPAYTPQPAALDPAFGTGGVVTQDLKDQGFSFDDRANDVAVLPDGRMLVTGQTGFRIGDYNQAMYLARYNADGTPDPSFGAGGIVQQRYGSEHGRGRALALLPDGRFYVAGNMSAVAYNGLVATVWRYNADGSPDPSFGDGGRVHLPSGAALSDVAVLSTGRVVVCGVDNHGGFAVFGFSPDGRPDQAFGTGGRAVMGFNDGSWDYYRAAELAAGPGDRITVVGTVPAPGGGDKEVALTRYLPDGTTDFAFGTFGVARTQLTAGDDVPLDLIVRPDGSTVVAGSSFTYGADAGTAFAIRHLPNGQQDMEFGSAGTLAIDTAGPRDAFVGVAADWDGKLLFAADVGGLGLGLVRTHPDGRPDEAFGPNGMVRTAAVGAEPYVPAAIAVRPSDGRIVAAGYTPGWYWSENAVVLLFQPTRPPGLDLRADSDTGDDDTDNRTRDATPTFNVTTDAPYYRVYRDGTLISGAFQAGPSFTAPPQPGGGGTYTLSHVDPAGNAVYPSHPLDVHIEHLPPPYVRSVAVNGGGGPQRSMVGSVSVEFSEPVHLAAGGLVVTRRGGGAAVPADANPSGDGLIWVLTFTGSQVAGGSLADGLYDLTATAGKVWARSSANTPMTADQTFGFHRLFADADGDRDVDGQDSRGFRGALGSELGMPAYTPVFDYDADGDVDGADSRAFRRRLGTEI